MRALQLAAHAYIFMDMQAFNPAKQSLLPASALLAGLLLLRP